MIASIWHVDATGAISLVTPNVPYSSMQWTRRASTVGEFTIELACPMPVEWPGRYLVTIDAEREVGIIEKVDAAEDDSGDSATISGRFAESLLDRWKAPSAGASVSGANARQAITSAFSTWHMDDAPEIAMGEGTEGKTGSSVAISLGSGDSAMEGMYSVAEDAGLVPILTLDWQAGTLVLEIVEGVDRTRGQSVRPVQVFSLAMATLADASYSGDYSVACSEVLAHGEKGEDGDKIPAVFVQATEPAADIGAVWLVDDSTTIPHEITGIKVYETEGLCPSDTLYPSSDLYPGGAGQWVDHVLSASLMASTEPVATGAHFA